MKRLFITLSLFSAIVGFSCTPPVVDEKVIRIVINPWFPYELWNEKDQRVEGATGEYVDHIFKELGYTAKFVVEPRFDHAIYMVGAEKVDAIYSLLETKERSKTILFSDSILAPDETSFYINKTTNPDLQGADVYKVNRQVVFGSMIGETADMVKTQPNFVFIRTFQNYKDIVLALDIKVVDVALLEKYNGIYEFNQYIKKNPNSTLKIAKMGNVDIQNLKIAFTKTPRGEKLKKEFDEMNRKLQKTDLLTSLFKKYVGEL